MPEVLKGPSAARRPTPAPASPRSGLIYPGFAPLLPALAWPTTPAPPLIPARPPDRPAPHEEHHTPNPAQLASDDQVDSTTADLDGRQSVPARWRLQPGRESTDTRDSAMQEQWPGHTGANSRQATGAAMHKREGMSIDHRHVPCRAVTTAAQSCLPSTPDLSSRRQ